MKSKVVWIPCPLSPGDYAGWLFLTKGLAGRRQQDADFRFIYLPDTGTKSSVWATLASALRYALHVRKTIASQSKGEDAVVFFPVFYLFNVVAAVLLPGRSDYVVRISGGELDCGNPIAYKFRLAMIRKARLIICLNKDSWRRLEAMGIPEERRVINPNPVSPEFRPPSPKERDHARQIRGFSNNDVVIGTVGTICERKRQLVLLEAIAEMENVRDVVVILCGPYTGNPEASETYMRQCHHRASRNGVRIIQTGQVSDVRSILWALDIFVLASAQEGMPNALLEAMACGLPAIASDIPGNSDALDSGDEEALLFPLDDCGALQSCLEHLCGDRNARLKQSKHSIARVKSTFSVEAADQAYLAALLQGTQDQV